MCGLSGFAGVPAAQAWGLVYGLGAGIDTRGGHASGYVSVRDSQISVHKKVGGWDDAPRRFIRGAAKSEICMMHARWATCGIKDSVDHAHPFEIVRDGKVVLYGAHNGIIYDGAEQSAKRYGREYTVDSREVFELLADGKYDEIGNLDGYGVLTWIVPGDKFVNMVRLSAHSEIEIIHLRAGGLVWGSTRDIIEEATDLAGLRPKYTYKVPLIGTTYKIYGDGLYETSGPKIQVSTAPRKSFWNKFVAEDIEEPDSWESELIAKWQAESDAKDGDPASDRTWVDEQLRTSWERDEEQKYPSIADTYE